MSVLIDTEYGFKWGPLEVLRAALFPRPGGDYSHVLTVKTDAGQSIDIYVSPKGNSIRVFKKGKELK